VPWEQVSIWIGSTPPDDPGTPGTGVAFLWLDTTDFKLKGFNGVGFEATYIDQKEVQRFTPLQPARATQVISPSSGGAGDLDFEDIQRFTGGGLIG